MKNELFNELLDITTLTTGWHLTRRASRNFFVENNFYIDVFSNNLKQNLDEKRNLAKKQIVFEIALIERYLNCACLCGILQGEK